MCMATLIPGGVDLPQDGLENGSITNNDGHGYAIASAAHGLEVFGSMEFDETMDSLIKARAKHGAGSVVLFHSRFGTHGELGPYNIHPFHVTDHTVMAHNGILPSIYHPKGKDRRSDTRIFVDRLTEVGVCDNDRGIPSRSAGQKLGSHIGSSNKLVFLSVASGKPKVRVINSHLGIHEGGVWYSNTGYIRSAYSWGSSGWSSGRTPSWWDEPGYWGGRYDSDTGKTTGGKPGILIGEGDDLEPCPICLVAGSNIDVATNWCIDCDFCMDCTEFADSCFCWPGSESARHRRMGDVVEIEDAADDGWVKYDGVWMSAKSLVRRPVTSTSDPSLFDKATDVVDLVEEQVKVSAG